MAPSSERKAQWLLLLGTLLFICGLFTGFAIPLFTNVKMGVEAHLEGVMNGMVLILFGAVWLKAELTPRLEKIAFATAIFGAWANWFFVSLAAAWGSPTFAPVAGKGFHASALENAIIACGLLAVSAAIITASCILAWGFLKKLQY